MLIARAADLWSGSQPAPRESRGARGTWSPPDALPEAPGPAVVLPALPNRRLKIECLPKDAGPQLSELVKRTCDRHAAKGLKLASTFSHDGSIFLIFKRL